MFFVQPLTMLSLLIVYVLRHSLIVEASFREATHEDDVVEWLIRCPAKALLSEREGSNPFVVEKLFTSSASKHGTPTRQSKKTTSSSPLPLFPPIRAPLFCDSVGNIPAVMIETGRQLQDTL